MSGGVGPNNEVMNNCNTLNISTNTLVRKANMNVPRFCHGLQKMSQKIFAFGGYGGASAPIRAEVYDVEANLWKKLPDMPSGGQGVTCVRVQNQILMSSR